MSSDRARAALLSELDGPHGSGLLSRLAGAQRMKEAGRSLSSDVAARIDNDAIEWIKRAATLLREPHKATGWGPNGPGRDGGPGGGNG